MHTVDWLTGAGLSLGWWNALDPTFSAVRMPLFFTISGLLGHGWVRAGWPELLARKVTNLAWVYLAWQPVGSLAAAASAQVGGGQLSGWRMLASLAATPLRPRSELWYLWALVGFFVLARWTLRRPIVFQIACAAAVCALWSIRAAPAGNLGWNGVPQYYVFFLIGCHHRALLLRLADVCRARWAVAAGVVLAWAVTVRVVDATVADQVVGPGFVIRLVGLGAGVAAAARLGRLDLLTRLGARTLPIYLAHTPLLIVLAWLVHVGARPGSAGVWAGPAGPVLTAVAPGLAAAAVIGGSLALYRGLASTTGRFLYAAPEPVLRAVHEMVSGRAGGPG